MTDKITLAPVGSLQDTTTAATTINNNFSTIQKAFDNTLSRDGTQPNQMGSTLDMNSNQIVNLPSPITQNSPVRMQDLTALVDGGTISISPLPVGGTVGQLLTKNSSANYDVSWIAPIVIPSAAYTIRGNATNALANDTDISIPGLTSKATPAAGDMFMIADSAASNALKSVTLGSLVTASGVSSIAGNTGAFTLTKGITNSTNAIGLALNNAVLQTGQLNPSSTVSTSGVMTGIGGTCTLTPVYSSRVRITMNGFLSNSTSGFLSSLQMAYGAGTAPTSGSSIVGTAVGSNIFYTTSANGSLSPFSLTCIITGLTPGTAYWFDLILATSNGATAAIVRNITAAIEEF